MSVHYLLLHKSDIILNGVTYQCIFQIVLQMVNIKIKEYSQSNFELHQ